MKFQKKTYLALTLSAMLGGAFATDLSPEAAVVVTPDNFIRAESDRYFIINEQLAGGVNQFNFIRSVTPLDQQSIVRMNRDTLYGSAVVDTKNGATVTFPEIPDGRYASILVLDNDHYAAQVIYEPGTYTLPDRTRYVLLAVRVHLLDPDDPADIAKATAIQDQFVIEANSHEPFVSGNWDQTSLDMLRAQYEKEMVEYERYPDSWQGNIGEVDETTRQIAVAGGWGLLPNRDALYINYNGKLSENECYRAQYPVPTVKENGFWSLTMYGDDGYMQSDNNILNNFNTELTNDKQHFVAYFGSEELCGDVPNRLDTTAGWNFIIRIYRPDEAVLTADYDLPTPEVVRNN